MTNSFSYKQHLLLSLIFILLSKIDAYSQIEENLVNFSQENYFIENKGQEHQDVSFTLKQGSSLLYLRENGFSVLQYDKQKYHTLVKNLHDNLPLGDTTIKNHMVHSTWVGSNTQKIFGKNFNPTYVNYIYGKDSSKWGLGINLCNEVYYDEIYSGIDLRFFSINTDLKYEYLVEPRAKANQLEVEYTGHDSLFINTYGQLVIQTSLKDIIEERPFVYQKIEGKIIEVPSHYSIKGNRVKIEIGNYDKDRVLVIDPTLIFSTYSGSNADNWGNTACYDSEGNLYAGSTVFQFKNTFPGARGSFLTTSGAYQTSFIGGDVDMGIIKFNAEGTLALYATYYGGNGSEVPLSMITDKNDNLVILSVTSSDNLAVQSSSFQKNKLTSEGGISSTLIGGYTFTSGTDLYLTKLNEEGKPINSTFFGGNRNDGIADLSNSFQRNYKNLLRGDIAIDSSENIIIASYSESSGLGKNSFDNNKSSFADGIIAKFNSELSLNLWTAYLGGTDDDALYSLALDKNQNIYVCGTSESFLLYSGIPGYTPSSLLSTSGLVAKISADGQTLMGLARLGTSSYDEVYFIELGTDETVYVTGQSEGNYPVSSGVFSNPTGGNFIHALTNDLQTSVFSTVIGRNGPQLVPTAFLVDDCDRIYLTGWGTNNRSFTLNKAPRDKGIAGFTTTVDAYKSTSDGNDFYLVVLEPQAKDIIYGSYFGGTEITEHLDGGMSRFDPKGVVYQSVCTGCDEQSFLGFPIYRGTQIFPLYSESPRQTYPRRKGDAFCNNAVFKFDLSSSETKIDLDAICNNQKITFRNNSVNAKNFTWNFGDGNTVSTANNESVFHEYTKTGEYKITLTSESQVACSRLLKDSVTVYVTTNVDAKAFFDTVCTKATLDPMLYSNLDGLTFNWINSSSTEVSDVGIANPKINVTKTKEFLIEITDTFGCQKTDTFAVTLPVIALDIRQTLEQSCGNTYVGRASYNNQVKVSNTSTEANYTWILPNGDILDSKNIATIYFKDADTTSLYFKTEVGQCMKDTTFSIAFQNIIYPNIFTPNGDGKNDTYVIDGLNMDNWKVSIINRWGKQVYASDNYQNDYKAENLKVGTYFYLIESPDKMQCKGWLQIQK